MNINTVFDRLRLAQALYNVAPQMVNASIGKFFDKKREINDRVIREVLHKKDQQQDTLFATDIGGYVKHFSVDTFELYKNCGKMHERSIKAMKTTKDGKTLFTAGYDKRLKQWQINTKNNEVILEKTEALNSLIIQDDIGKENLNQNQEKDPGSRWEGLINQTQDKKQENLGYELIKDYGEISSTSVTTMVLSDDENYLYTGDANGILKIWNVPKKCLHSAWGKIHAKEITEISINSLNYENHIKNCPKF